MTRALAHRGPDGEGFWNDGIAYFGHRRLSIIDLAGGQQPIRIQHQGEHVIVFNGEIYNYQRLRDSLHGENIPWKTRSDTEVLLWLLAKRGAPAGLADVCGMFAFAWWDQQRRRLVLVRDRLGIKPLYYSVGGGGSIAFSSSLESLIRDPAIDRVLDSEALEYLLTLGYPPAPLTMYQGVRELPPGCCLTWQDGTFEVQPYWTVRTRTTFRGSEREATEQLDSLLDEVVRDHMVSDVPVGAFLSGGIDSSAVVARARKFADANFQAFTVSFPDARYDESAAAARTAKHLHVPHSILPMAQMPVDDDACRFVLEHVGQPFADSSALPTYVVSRGAGQKSTVVLSGDGGDELFAGYDDFDWLAKITAAQAVPKFLRRALLPLLNGIRGPAGVGDRLRQVKKGLRYSLEVQPEMLLRLKSILDPEEVASKSSLFGATGPGLSLLREFLRNEGRSEDANSELARFLTAVCLPGDMLRKVDSMSMAASIEVRVPLLDHRIVEFAHSLPFSLKRKGGVKKWVFRQAVKRDLPAELFSRPKWGFSIPLHRTFTPRFYQFCRDMFRTSDGYVRRWFGDDFLEALVHDNEFSANTRPDVWSVYTRSHVLWLLVQLETWCQTRRVSVGQNSRSAAVRV